MFFYFSKLWFLWLIVLVLSAILAWWLCRRFRGPRKPVVDQRQVRELADARAAANKHESRVNELLSLRAKDLDEVTSLRSQIGTVDELRAKVRTLEAGAAGAAALQTSADQVAGLQARIAELEAELAARHDAPAAAPATEPQALVADGGTVDADVVDADVADAAAAPAERATDVSGAAAVLGAKVAPDDLKVVEGIGPKIEELLHADGIRTWRALAAADPARLKGVLDAGGPRFQVHDPATWPRQAELLANAEWAAFKELTDNLKGGRG